MPLTDHAFPLQKECIECWGGPGKACGKDHNGSFACCQSGRCAVADPSDDLPTEYKMRLTIKYTRELEKVQPVDIETYLAPGCQCKRAPFPA